MTSAQLAEKLSLTPANIRYHLSTGIKQGQIISLALSRKNAPGRPPRLFTATTPVHLTLLPEILSESVSGKTSMNALAGKICQSHFPSMPIESAQTILITRLVKFLGEKGYTINWHASINGAEIVIRHCPYHSVLDYNPWLCEFDRCLIATCTDIEVAKVTTRFSDPFSPCRFLGI